MLLCGALFPYLPRHRSGVAETSQHVTVTPPPLALAPEKMKVEDRWRAVHAVEDCMTYEAIEKKYGYTQDFIARWVRRYRETGAVDDAPHEGRPLKLTPTKSWRFGALSSARPLAHCARRPRK